MLAQPLPPGNSWLQNCEIGAGSCASQSRQGARWVKRALFRAIVARGVLFKVVREEDVALVLGQLRGQHPRRVWLAQQPARPGLLRHTSSCHPAGRCVCALALALTAPSRSSELFERLNVTLVAEPDSCTPTQCSLIDCAGPQRAKGGGRRCKAERGCTGEGTS